MILGIVGKPNCGKSTFFKACTLADVEIANYPFATIKPNRGAAHVKVRCAELDFDTKCNPRTGFCTDAGERFVPVEVIDVAGLVPGAHEGKGMGLSFLNDLNQADALIQVIDLSGSTNEKGEPVDRLSYDPSEDIAFLERELVHWFDSVLSSSWDKFVRTVDQTDLKKEEAFNKQLSGLGTSELLIKDALKKLDLPEFLKDWSAENRLSLCSELRKLVKPIIVAANKADVPGAIDNLERIKARFPDVLVIPCSAESELALREADAANIVTYVPGSKEFKVNSQTLNDRQKKGLEFIQSNVLDDLEGTGVQRVINDAIFNVLDHIFVFPGGLKKLEDKDGNRLPDCFLIPNGSTALDFAFRVHTDLGKKFIRAVDVKKRLTVGKEHTLKSGDVIEIIT